MEVCLHAVLRDGITILSPDQLASSVLHLHPSTPLNMRVASMATTFPTRGGLNVKNSNFMVRKDQAAIYFHLDLSITAKTSLAQMERNAVLRYFTGRAAKVLSKVYFLLRGDLRHSLRTAGT